MEYQSKNLEKTAGDPIDLSNFTLDMIRHMSILSGCDYLKSLKGLGIRKSFSAVKQIEEIKIGKTVQNKSATFAAPVVVTSELVRRAADQVIRHIRLNFRFLDRAGVYEKDFQKADALFQYQ